MTNEDKKLPATKEDKYEQFMVDTGAEAQILCKAINDKSMLIFKANNVDEEFFAKYKDLFKFLTEHEREYGNIPDVSTIAIKFNDFEIFDVVESEKYLIDQLYEQHNYRKTCIVVKQLEPMLVEDSNKAIEFLMSEIPKLAMDVRLDATNIIERADIRLQEYKYLQENHESIVIKTGFDELDDLVFGWKPVTLAFVIGRPNEGKSWLLHKFAESAWVQKKRVGIYSGEMPASDVGYRLDTLNKHISNTCLVRGNKIIDQEYSEHIVDMMQNPDPIFIATQKEFAGEPTASKIEAFIQKNKLDIVFLDQLSLMRDQRSSKGNKRIEYENICKDLLDLTMRLQVPIIVAAQANRKTGEDGDEDKLPRLEHIAESDAVGQTATNVIAMCQKDGRLLMQNIKNRNLARGGKLVYDWMIDKGIFEFNPEGTAETEDSGPMKRPEIPKRRTKKGEAF